MDTPITISSSASSVDKPSKKSECSIARVPGGWDSPAKRRESNCTPTSLQKVNNWINSLNRVNRKNVGGSKKPSSDFNESDNGLDMEGDFLHGMVVTSGLSKSLMKKDNLMDDELNQFYSPTDSSYEKLRSSQANPKMPDDIFYTENSRKYSHPKAIKRRKLIQTPNTVEKPEESDSDVPLSPENEQKKELCSYLQLMKPTDKKTVMILQNRRSTRVKNLSLMQEKRELEKKLREEHSEDTTDNNSLSKFPSLQSIADVNNDEVEKRPVIEYFHFPRPRDDLRETVTDFEDAIEEDWFKDWKEQTNKNLVAAQSLNVIPDKEVVVEMPTTRNLSKRTCQENVSSDRKAKSINNEGKIENQKKKVQIKARALNGVKNKQDKNGHKEESRRSSNDSLKTPSSKSEHFILPKPSLHLMTGVCDFADAIQDNADLIKDKKVDCVKPKTIEIENKSSKPANKQVRKKSSETSIVENGKDLSKDKNSSKLSIKTKEKLKKKNKMKKSKKVLLLCRSSSFKIKLVTKKKNSVSRSKTSKKLNRNIANDFSSHVQSSTAKKQVMTEENQTKKENLKQTPPSSPKKSKPVTESPPKTPLKDTNENPLEFESPLPHGDEKTTNSIPAITESPKTSDLSPITKRSPKKNIFASPKKTVVDNAEDSHPSTIMAIFKYDSNSTANLLKPAEEDGFYSQILNIEKGSDDGIVTTNGEIVDNKTQSPTERLTNSTKTCTTPNSSSPPFISFKKDVSIKPLHRCLKTSKQKSLPANPETANSPTNWASGSPSHKQKKDQHSIHISMEDGVVLKIFYMEFNLVLCQELIVSFWTQTALGNVLGAQNMFISKGSVQRLSMNNNCVFKEALEMVVSTDTNVAYIELWTKEHQSDIREGPVADIFAIVYFWRKGFIGDKKVLQLENINGFADDVQYSVLKSSPKIVVSWHLTSNEIESKKTFIHCYELSADFQSVCNISEFEAVEHYVSSLHNIVGCDTLIMGCGENKITLWNIENGYVVATIEMLEIKSPLSTLWVKCDRGFLFTLQQCVDRELRLIAIHGMNHSWKKLASYVPPVEYDRLKGVCIENGIVLAFYEQGIVCWNAQTAETVLETAQNEAEYISGKYIISIVNDQVNLRHAVTHLLCAEES